MPLPSTALDRPPTQMTFEQYVVSSRERLFRLAMVLCGDPVLAGDLVTDVLGRAFERWHQVGAADHVHAYVRRMVVNEFVSWKRRASRTSPHAEIGDLVDLRSRRVGDYEPDPAETQSERAALLGELARLGPQQRAAIVLRFFEDLGDDEIAGILGCRAATVRGYVSRGLASLRVSLDPASDTGTAS